VTEVKERVAALPNDAVIFYTAIFIDGAGVVHTPQSALLAISEVTSRPIFTDVDSQVGYGAVGGFVFSIIRRAGGRASCGAHSRRRKRFANPGRQNRS
jgi:hypothetical protein